MKEKFNYTDIFKHPDLLALKIKNIEYAINQSKILLKESNLNSNDLQYIKRKISKSLIELEQLYLIQQRLNNCSQFIQM